MVPFAGPADLKPGVIPTDDVVEIGLLLPANWANALVELSRQRGQSVAQILRGWIDRALTDERQRSERAVPNAEDSQIDPALSDHHWMQHAFRDDDWMACCS